MILRIIRKSFLCKVVASYLSLYIVLSVFFNQTQSVYSSNSSGYNGITLGEFGESVDPFTGDFSYKISLHDIEGFPLNLNYNANITANQEASWVGLGWNLNLGEIRRQLRGIPDDFNGDIIEQTHHVKPNITSGINIGKGKDLHGTFPTPYNVTFIGGYSNLYKIGSFENSIFGKGSELSLHYDFSFGASYSVLTGISSTGIGLLFNSQSGINFGLSQGQNFSVSYKNHTICGISGNVSASYNTRSGIKEISFSNSYTDPSEFSKSFWGESDVSSTALSSLSLGTPSYIPRVKHKTFSSNGGSSLKIGTLNSGNLVYGDNNYSGKIFNYGLLESYLGVSFKINETELCKSYGYFNVNNADENEENIIIDYNNDKDGIIYKTTPYLPATNFTKDIFYEDGPDYSSSFSASRNDIGTVFNGQAKSLKTLSSEMKEFGIGLNASADFDSFSFGINPSFHRLKGNVKSENNQSSGKWNNPASSILDFHSYDDTSPAFEPYFFEETGEYISWNENYYDQLLGTKEARLSFSDLPYTVFPSGSIQDLNNATQALQNDQRNNVNQRAKRNTEHLVNEAKDANKYNFEPIKSYCLYDQNTYNGSEPFYGNDIDRLEPYVKPNHVSEIIVTKPGGRKYIYGIPVYSFIKKDVAFNVSGNSVNSGLVSYSNVQNSTDNLTGIDGLYTSTTTHEYVEKLLLTAVLGDDYVDVTGDGLTDDDLGNYTKIQYTRLYDVSQPFNWRFPYYKNKAYYNEGIKFDDPNYGDDIGSYTYGAKEIWYPQTIITKNFIVEFYLDDREDAIGVLDENGGLDNTKRLKCLKEIRIYNKKDRVLIKTAATPIKTIHFEYFTGAESQCINAPGCISGKGKLTLKSVYFTYGNSLKGQEYKYQFTYNQNNPNYSQKDIDRWDNYKPESLNGYTSNIDYPYATQDPIVANNLSKVWKLESISLPTGVKLSINYEADKYSFVQDEKAMQLTNILAFGKLTDSYPPESNSDFLHVLPGIGVDQTPNTRIFYSRTDPTMNCDNILDLYFKCFVDITGNGDYQFVNGYAKVINSGQISPEIGFVDVKSEKVVSDYYQDDMTELLTNHKYSSIVNDITGVILSGSPLPLLSDYQSTKYVNPIARAAFQDAILKMPQLVWPQCGNQNQPLSCFLNSFNTDLKTIFQLGINQALYKKGFGRKVDLNQAWIRVNSPSSGKFGGNHRVKTITYTNNWNGSEINHIKDFSYWNGVATYEPINGNDENALKKPIPYRIDNFLFTDLNLYQEEPLGESFFPSPTIGYSSIIITDKSDIANSPSSHNKGYTKYEFYTAKDFPIVVFKNVQRKPVNTENGILQSLIDFTQQTSVDYYAISQGYAIHLNDMHGKLKSVIVYNNLDQMLQGHFYEYSSYKDPITNKNMPETNVQTINQVGNVSQSTQNQKMDVYVDAAYHNEEENYEFSTQSQDINSLTSLIGAGLGLISGILGNDSELNGWSDASGQKKIKRGLYRTVMTKVVTRSGVLKSVKHINDGIATMEKYIAWDEETGFPLLIEESESSYISNSPINEPHWINKKYLLSIPAHWMYKNMRNSYINSGMMFTSEAQNGNFNIANANNYFTNGDVIIATPIDQPDLPGEKWWVLNTYTDHIECIKKDGSQSNQAENTYSIKIIESGYANKAFETVQFIQSLKNPIDKDNDNQVENINFNSMNDLDVISTSATEFTDLWKTHAEIGITSYYNGNKISNPFLQGLRGIWRPYKTWDYFQERSYEGISGNLDVRKQGIFAVYESFWKIVSSEWAPIYEWNSTGTNWRNTNTISKYDPKNGNAFEIQNVLTNKISAEIFGYDQMHPYLPIATAVNAQSSDILFDSFEDYFITGDIIIGHGNFSSLNPLVANISSSEHHSGKKSLKLAYQISYPITCSNSNENEINIFYDNILEDNELYERFNPKPNDYLISFWLKIPDELPATSYGAAIARFKQDQNEIAIEPKGYIIDGWQKFESKITLNEGTATLEFGPNQEESLCPIYIDDIRIHPYLATMTSTVYNSENFKIMAILGENNYPTYYEYNEDGELIRIKKENHKGIFTIYEENSELKKGL